MQIPNSCYAINYNLLIDFRLEIQVASATENFSHIRLRPIQCVSILLVLKEEQNSAYINRSRELWRKYIVEAYVV